MNKCKSIVFEGELSIKNKDFFIIKIKTIIFFCFFIPCLILSIPFAILSFSNDLIFLLPVIFLLFFPVIFFIIKNKFYEDMLPYKIVICNKGIISTGKNFENQKAFNTLLKIIDYGNCYKMYFKFPYKNQSFICQKDLIVEGSLEEFEKLFEDKIIKKY